MENPIMAGDDGGETCPDCWGEGKHHGIGCLAPGNGCRPVTITRSLCEARGRISTEQADWWRTGQHMRMCRLGRNHTIRMEADRRGMKATELSDMEHGRVRPAPCYEDGGL